MTHEVGRAWNTAEADLSPGAQCAGLHHGAWWNNNCLQANLNGLCSQSAASAGVTWLPWLGANYSLRASEMKMHPVAWSNSGLSAG